MAFSLETSGRPSQAAACGAMVGLCWSRHSARTGSRPSARRSLHPLGDHWRVPTVVVGWSGLNFMLVSSTPREPHTPTPVRKIEKTYADPLGAHLDPRGGADGDPHRRSAEVNASWNGDRRPHHRHARDARSRRLAGPDDSPRSLPRPLRGARELPKPGLGARQLQSGQARSTNTPACDCKRRWPTRSGCARSSRRRRCSVRTTIDSPPTRSPPATTRRSRWPEPPGSAPRHGPWAAPLREALERTALIARALHGVTTEDSLWRELTSRGTCNRLHRLNHAAKDYENKFDTPN